MCLLFTSSWERCFFTSFLSFEFFNSFEGNLIIIIFIWSREVFLFLDILRRWSSQLKRVIKRRRAQSTRIETYTTWSKGVPKSLNNFLIDRINFDIPEISILILTRSWVSINILNPSNLTVLIYIAY